MDSATDPPQVLCVSYRVRPCHVGRVRSTVAEVYDLGRSTAYQVVKGDFPEPVVLPGGHYRYPADRNAKAVAPKRIRAFLNAAFAEWLACLHLIAS